MSFFSFLSPDVQGELLKTEFAKYGKVTAFKFFEKDHKMALIQMETIDDAVMGLIVSICCDRHTLVIYGYGWIAFIYWSRSNGVKAFFSVKMKLPKLLNSIPCLHSVCLYCQIPSSTKLPISHFFHHEC